MNPNPKPANETPGKFDDFLEQMACFTMKMSEVFAFAKDNYVDPDGTFQDIKFVEFEKWLPIIRFLASKTQEIGEQCFGADMTPELKDGILKVILDFLGFRTDNPQQLVTLSKILNL